MIEAISASTLSRVRRVFPRASVAASSSIFFAAFARVVPVNPRAWASCSSGEWVRTALRSAPKATRRVSNAVSPPNRFSSATFRFFAGSARRSAQSEAGTDPM